MWHYTLPFTNGSELYQILSLFFLYSFLGWLVESIYMSICNRKITNRGFIHGPICPIYGIGALLVYYCLHPFSHNYIILYFAGAVIATTLEFIAAKFMISIFGCVWWDYTNKPLNYKGILCLESTLAWGLYIVFQFLFLQQFMMWLINQAPLAVNKLLIILLVIYYLLDFTYCIRNIRKGEITARENNLLAVHQKNRS